jgi:muramidase (phage lysozyme)
MAIHGMPMARFATRSEPQGPGLDLLAAAPAGPAQRRFIAWVGDRVLQGESQGQRLQGRLMSAEVNGRTEYGLEGLNGQWYSLQRGQSRVRTREDARDRARELIRNGAATKLYELRHPRPVEVPAVSAPNPLLDFFGKSSVTSSAQRGADKLYSAGTEGVMRTAWAGQAGDAGASTQRPYAMTVERRALLNTIRYAEGTWKGGQDVGYRLAFTGVELEEGLRSHPNRVFFSPGYASAASGAYQFMPATWDLARRGLRARGFELPDFGADAQDQAALYLVAKRGALALLDAHGLTVDVLHRLAPEWASFPTRAGVSYYRQPVKAHAELYRFYDQEVTRLRTLEQQQPEPVRMYRRLMIDA